MRTIFLILTICLLCSSCAKNGVAVSYDGEGGQFGLMLPDETVIDVSVTSGVLQHLYFLPGDPTVQQALMDNHYELEVGTVSTEFGNRTAVKIIRKDVLPPSSPAPFFADPITVSGGCYCD